MKNAGKSMHRSRNSWRRAFMDGLWGHHVVLAGGTGLYLIISGGRTIRSALLLSVLVFCMVVPLWLLAVFCAAKLPRGCAFPDFYGSLGAVFAVRIGVLAAVSLTGRELGVVRCSAVGKRTVPDRNFRRFLGQSLRSVLGEAMGSAAGFSCVLLAVSLGWKLLDGMGMQEGSTAFDRAPVLMVLLFLAVLAAAAQYWKNRNRKKQKERGICCEGAGTAIAGGVCRRYSGEPFLFPGNGI